MGASSASPDMMTRKAAAREEMVEETGLPRWRRLGINTSMSGQMVPAVLGEPASSKPGVAVAGDVVEANREVRLEGASSASSSGINNSSSGQMVPAVACEPASSKPRVAVAGVQRSGGDPAAQPRRRARYFRRNYSEDQKAAATPLIAKLMQLADFDSNVKGGGPKWKQMFQEARDLASPEKHPELDEVKLKFKQNTVGIHASMCDRLIAQWQADPDPLAPGQKRALPAASAPGAPGNGAHRSAHDCHRDAI